MEIRLETPAGVIAAKAWGPAEGPRVLALHGWLDNAASFDRLAPLLPDYRIIAVDLPGHGRSYHRPAHTFYHLVDTIPVIGAILHALQWKTCRLLGHSLGGGIAAVYAGTHPEQIEKLALVESLGPISQTAEETPDRLRTFAAEWARFSGKTLPTYRSLAEMEALRLKVSDLTPESVTILTERGSVPQGDGFTWASDPKLRITTSRLTEPQVQAFLSRIACPVLAVRASKGLQIGREWFEARLRCLKDVRVETVEGGHHVHLDHPHPVAAVIKQFLQ